MKGRINKGMDGQFHFSTNINQIKITVAHGSSYRELNCFKFLMAKSF